jgi:hypothetical protein
VLAEEDDLAGRNSDGLIFDICHKLIALRV